MMLTPWVLAQVEFDLTLDLAPFMSGAGSHKGQPLGSQVRCMLKGW